MSSADNKSKDQGKFDIDLPGAADGKVVTRFPPEPSGYLHIGHAKAALLNQYFAQHFNGKLIIRFDDTNPSKEKSEFEASIKEDLSLLGIHGDVVSHTSDYFDQIYDLAIDLIKSGKGYVDDTDKETMRDQRMHGIASKNRDLSIEENLKRFEEMRQGTEFGLTCCLRGKVSVDDKNKAMRDPVFYRCNITPHHITGDKWKIYPTYDFACPIVDSLEGVTHALRTIEYRDRNPQYHWVIDALNLRKVFVWDFSRVNFIYTLLSKRKLQWFVDQDLVTGWDDPRFPTVRGIRRRGMTIEGLKQYMLMQGASQNNLLLEWDKIWANNKKIIDPVAPRYVALDKEKLTSVKIVDGPTAPETKEIPVHKKNLELGNKTTFYSSHILLAHDDAKDLTVGEEITLMDWGNAIVEQVSETEITMKLHLEGDFKKTKKKLTWLSNDQKLTPVELLDYDYLINKKKLEEEDSVADFITPITEFKVEAVADHNVANLNAGGIVQLERKGYYIVDSVAIDSTPIRLIAIPDGKAKNIASKSDDKKTEKKAEKPAPAANPNANAKKAAEKERKKLEKKLKKQAHKDGSKPDAEGEGVQQVTEQLNEVKLDQ